MADGKAVITEPWTLAVADAAEEEIPASPEDVIRDELRALWHDLDTAIDATIKTRFSAPGAWSVHAISIGVRIIILSQIAGATPWEQVPTSRLLDGTYQGMLTAAGIEHAEPGEDDLRQMREWIEGQREAARRGR